MPSTNSEIGAAVLECQLIPSLRRYVPDIVILAYSTNDSKDPDRNATFHVHEQSLLRAAHMMRPCDDDLLLVILADDMHGLLDEGPALETTGSLYKLASWYNVMAVTYGNVARHASIASYVNISYPNPLLGSAYDDIHLGVGFHIGIAWTLLFNLMAAFHDTCFDVVGVGSTSTSTTVPVTEGTLDSMKWSLMEPPTKYQGRISSMDEASQEWKDRIEWKGRNCPTAVGGETGPYATSRCTYAWMVNPETITEPRHIDAALESVLVRADGWKAGHFSDPNAVKPPGFGTDTPQSSFRLVLRNVTQVTRSVTIFSVRSYRPKYINSTLRLTVRIQRHDAEPSSGSSNTTNHSDGASRSVTSYEVQGGHDERTSVYFPHKFLLPGGGARVGDTIRLDANLVSGRAFVIQAFAFCHREAGSIPRK